ncbi:MAG: hypothetical protein A2Z62_00640 [Candidatus Terrybacteria bacterium RIFCSPLOWO2_02_42_20]|uniref:Baseplate protein J-like domain-containing protein n=1 Tax=Candidatus Terrybacteria bacterium RIFCSPLOWO2_02_42_20 TaxID=1802370 RepID=A0A1G2Q1T5_9BACT|nr:MAG: hypothetical protein A2Z62_00640 [Candidatus Terrybacteria bacterium RIFCSPLOWO2_02_42_20]
MPRKIIKDVFLRKKEERPLVEELEMEKTKKSRFLFKLVISFLILILLGALGAVILNRISTVAVNVSPYKETLAIDSRIRARANATADGLLFEIAQLNAEESGLVTATGISSGGQYASGKIIVYNNYGSAPQRLIANTRFQTSDGKVYRIKGAISVPGMGMTEATVYADQAGEEYNIKPTDFTLPGLKGGPRFEKVFAKSKSAMSGGSSVNARVVKKEDIDSVRTAVNEKLKNRLTETLSKQKPEGYVLFAGAVKIEYMENPDNPKVGDSSSRSMAFKTNGSATGYLFKKDALAKALADDSSGDLKKAPKNEPVAVDNVESLDFSLISADAKNKEITVRLKGNADFVWVVDTAKLLEEIVNYKGKGYTSVFQNYPAIEKAAIVKSPKWWPRFPKDKSKIKINIETGKATTTSSQR